MTPTNHLTHPVSTGTVRPSTCRSTVWACPPALSSASSTVTATCFAAERCQAAPANRTWWVSISGIGHVLTTLEISWMLTIEGVSEKGRTSYRVTIQTKGSSAACQGVTIELYISSCASISSFYVCAPPPHLRVVLDSNSITLQSMSSKYRIGSYNILCALRAKFQTSAR